MVQGMLAKEAPDFTGFVFPAKLRAFRDAAIPARSLFQSAEFLGDADFCRARFLGDVSFRDIHVHGNAEFRDAEFAGYADFGRAVIERFFELGRARIEGSFSLDHGKVGNSLCMEFIRVGGTLRLCDVEIGDRLDMGLQYVGTQPDEKPAEIGGNIDLSGARIAGTVSLRSVKSGRNLEFWQARIGGDIDLTAVRVGGNLCLNDAGIGGALDMTEAAVSGEADFMYSRIEGFACLRSSTFRRTTQFFQTKVGGSLILTKAAFRSGANFSGTPIPFSGGFFQGMSIPKGHGESACRFAKLISNSMGNYDEAGMWHYEERLHAWHARKRRAAVLSLRKMGSLVRSRKSRHAGRDSLSCRILKWASPYLARFLAWFKGLPDQLFARGIFGYGERPLNCLRAWFAIVLVCWFIYMASPLQFRHVDSPSRVISWWEALYFSATAFIAVSFGDWHPTAGSLMAVLAALESVLGTITVALFIVAMARRWGRG